MQAFYKQYFLSLIQDGFAVMTDSLHKLVFQIHPMLLRSIFHIVQNNQVTVPLFDPSSQLAGTTNQALLHDLIPMSQLACIISFQSLGAKFLKFIKIARLGRYV